MKHIRIKMYSAGTTAESSFSAALRKHQSHRTTMKQLNANIGAVHIANICHNEVEEWRSCQPGHAPGGSISSSAIAVMAERSKAIKMAVRADFIATHRSVACHVRLGSKAAVARRLMAQLVYPQLPK